MLIGVVVVWAAGWLCLSNGVKTVGKVVMWTVPIPLVLLVILMIRAVTLPNAVVVLTYYLKPDWSALLKPGV